MPKTAPIYQLNITPAKALEIKPNARYLLIFDKKDAGTDAELTQLNEALKELFEGKVLAIFAKDINTVKIGELFENE